MLGLPPAPPHGRLDQPGAAAAGPLRAGRLQRLLRRPGRGRPVRRRGSADLAHGHDHLRRRPWSAATSAAGPGIRRITDPAHRATPRTELAHRPPAERKARRTRHRMASPSRRRDLAVYDADLRPIRRQRGGLMAHHEPATATTASATCDRRAGLPDPRAEGADPAGGRSRGWPNAPGRVLDPRGVPGRVPATRGLRPGVPRRRGPHPRRPLPGPQDPRGVRLRPRPRPQTRPSSPTWAPWTSSPAKENVVFLGPARHRQDPPGHRHRDPRLPGRAPGRCSPPPPSGSTGSPPPTHAGRLQDELRRLGPLPAAGHRRGRLHPVRAPRPRTCSSSSSPPATSAPR